MASQELTLAQLDATLADNKIVIIDFWANWCGPCKMFGPIFEAASNDHPDMVFAKCDTEAQQDLAAAFQISSIPTLAIFKEGVLLFKEPGMLPKEALEDLLSQVAALDMDKVRAEIEEKKATA